MSYSAYVRTGTASAYPDLSRPAVDVSAKAETLSMGDPDRAALVWIEGDLIVPSSNPVRIDDRVSRYRTAAGARRHAKAPTGKVPLAGAIGSAPALDYAAGQRLELLTYDGDASVNIYPAGGAAFSIVAVMQQDARTIERHIAGTVSGAGFWPRLYTNTGGSAVFNAGGTLVGTGVLALSTPHLLVASYAAGGAIAVAADGGAFATNTGAPVLTTLGLVIGDHAASNLYWDGEIALVGIMPWALADGSTQSARFLAWLEAYAAATYGVTLV